MSDYKLVSELDSFLAVASKLFAYRGELLWRTKKPTHREKDIPDLQFLRNWFKEQGKEPPTL